MSAPRDFHVELSTGRWCFVVEPLCGVTIGNKGHEQVVVVEPSAETRERLDTLVHETLHASKPWMSEKEVVRVAGDLAKVLWRAGYRRQ